MFGRRWSALLFVTLLLLAPTAYAAPPQAGFTTAASLAAQDVSDIAVDATGRFGILAPVYTSAKVPLPGQEAKRDLYVCDFASSGCHGYNHGSTSGSGTAQTVDAVSFLRPNGITARYAVGGPGTTVSLWTNLRSSAEWSTSISGNSVAAVALDPRADAWNADPVAAHYVVAGSGSLSSSNKIYVLNAKDGEVKWDWQVRAETGSTTDVSPTSLAYAPNGDFVVVGTTKGVLFLRPTQSAAPSNQVAANAIDVGNVQEVQVARDGSAVLVRTTTGIDYIEMSNGKPERPHWTRPLPSQPTAMALSSDGRFFAAAAGSEVHFFRHLGNSLVAEPVGKHDTGQNVVDIDYDATGSLLVAGAGNRVFGLNATGQRLWSFDATQSVHGGLDGPLRAVSVSDDADRIVIAGKTKVMPYTTEVSAFAQVLNGSARTINPGASTTVPLQITNDGSLPDNFTLVVKRPVGWTGDDGTTFQLLPDESRDVDLLVQSPAGVRPGTEAVTVEVRSQKVGKVVASTVINFTVPRAVQLEIVPTREQVVLQPGEQESVEFTIRNVGNAEGLVNLSARQSLSRGPTWDVEFQPEQLSIPPRGEATTQVLLRAPEDAASGDRNTLTLVAREGTLTEATHIFTAFINPQFTVDVNTGALRLDLKPAETRTFTINVTNSGNTDDRYNITANVTPVSQVNDWNVRVSKEQVDIGKGRTERITITIRPDVAEPREGASLVIRATSIGSGDTVSDSVNVALIPIQDDEEAGRFLPMPSLGLLLGAVGAVLLLRRARREGLE